MRRLPAFVSGPLLGALDAWVAQERAACPSSALGVMRGAAWAGPKGQAEPVRTLVEALHTPEPGLVGLRWEAWAVVLGSGGAIGWHDHYQALHCAAVYLRVPPNAAPILFRSGPVRPCAGDVLLFAGTDSHAVEPGAGERWSVAINFYA